MNFKTIDPVIKTERLTKKYGSITVVDNLDLDVAEGEILGFPDRTSEEDGKCGGGNVYRKWH